MVRNAALALVVVGLSLPSTAVAQQAQAPERPGTLVVSLQRCSLDTLDELNEFTKTVFLPILEAQVRAGTLLGWGEFQHDWGDEWNVGWYYLARDKAQFFAAFDEFLAEVLRRDPEALKKFGRWCSDHRDNIYDVTQWVAPPR